MNLPVWLRLSLWALLRAAGFLLSAWAALSIASDSAGGTNGGASPWALLIIAVVGVVGLFMVFWPRKKRSAQATPDAPTDPQDP